MKEPTNDERRAGGRFAAAPWLDRPRVITKIKEAQRRYAALFEGTPWEEEQLSDIGWLCLMAVPWLLDEVENNREHHRENGNADGNPRTDGVGLAKPPIQFVLPKHPHPNPALVVPAGNKVTHFFGGLLAKLKRIVIFHKGVMRSNDKALPQPPAGQGGAQTK